MVANKEIRGWRPVGTLTAVCLVVPLLEGCGQAALSGELKAVESGFDSELHIKSGGLPQATVGAPYRAQLKASGGVPPYDWHVVYGGLPRGLALDAKTGVISGVPVDPGTADFVVYVRPRSQGERNAVGWRASSIHIQVSAAAPAQSPAPALAPAATTTGTPTAEPSPPGAGA